MVQLWHLQRYLCKHVYSIYYGNHWQLLSKHTKCWQ